MKRSLLLLSIVLLYSLSSIGQVIGTTNFSALPRDYQLYPRDNNNQGLITIKGSTTNQNTNYYSVVVNRDNAKYLYQKANINISSSLQGNFAFPNIFIKAEKSNYDFYIYQVLKSGDSTLITQAKNVVAGDVIVLTGQSNSTGFFNDSRTNPFCRTFGKITDIFNTAYYNAADTLWTISNKESYTFGVGTMGFELQKLILDNYGIPTCLINGGTHWSGAQQHALRTVDNPTDLTNTYGRLLYRIQKAGLQNAVKAFIYRQGESEAYGEGSNFKKFFNIILSNLAQDLPSIKKLYLFQIDIIENAVGYAPFVREEQREFGITNPSLIDIVPSIGTIGFDGLHYSTEGYQQNGAELFRLYKRDFLGATDDGNFSAPNIQKAYYTTPQRNQIAVVFQKGQLLKWPENVNGLKMVDFLYLNGTNGHIKSWAVYKNAILLDLFNTNSSTTIDYLPPIVNKGDPLFPYVGPYITNQLGMRALSFYQYPIGDYDSKNPIPGNTDPVISFSKIPQNLQMFPRNSSNTSEIEVKATLQEAPIKYDYVSILTKKNSVNYSYSKVSLSYNNSKTDFSLKTNIKAELASYAFSIYAVTGTDSILLATRTDLASGDFFTVMGQTNAKAWHTENNTVTYNFYSPYCRTFGTKANSNYALTDTTWKISGDVRSEVGVWALELQRKLAKQYGIPSTIINESASSTPISQQNITNLTGDDISSVYGRLLYRVKKAGIGNQIKATFWWGGEVESRSGASTSYPSEFDKLYKRLRSDFPSTIPLYTFQSNIYYNGVQDAGKMRDFQRTIGNNYANTKVFSSLGYDGFDGVTGQYSLEGYTQIANTLWNTINNDLYATTKTSISTSPQVQKVFYNDTNKKEVVVIFDEGQTLVWPNDVDQNGNKYEMRFYFYLDKSSADIGNGSVNQNRLTLTSNTSSSAKTLTYLPDFMPSSGNTFDTRATFNGPFLKNSLGLSAFSFKDFPIVDALNSPVLSVSKATATSLDIAWSAIATATSYIIEIYKAGNNTLLKQNIVSGTTLSVSFTGLEDKTQYFIKAKVISATSESPYSSITALTFNPLKAPTLTGNATYFNAIQINWGTSDTDVTGFVLERKTPDASNYTVLLQPNIGTNSFADVNLTANTTYQYRIKSKNSVTESPYTTLEIKTPALLNTPTLKATAASEFSINLSWENIGGTNTYQIEKDSGNSNFQLLTKTDGNTLTFTDTKLEANTSYSYRIKAFSSFSESNYAFATARTLVILGFDDPSFSKTLLYPNPNNGKFVIKFEKPYSGELRVIDYLGRENYNIKLNQSVEKELDLSHLPSGNYFINCQSGNVWHTIKFQLIQNP
ncbi:sialate O-acetylesterase [Flectobacillus rivi]|uniref:Sialate O-acetylesterase n=1 Tax=Flectobacillus rivi TaxID=2984209 RepID=A0ABT6Z195_9BACT|nr:sialate O-acetylesterase [Flectobacillus rivi]MDI9874404.1 sialate O-acetylesterase [Flectobacillus rivi]